MVVGKLQFTTNNYKASDKAKDKLRKNAIKQFDPKTGEVK
ncbi:Acid phosphatase [Staphylococcus aureus]|uniref:Acid phosphatase n=1 Tax=Staphylococcus aureus TaxID=1280 RepID=A0A380DLY2_STAAU|nr:Acid phosphatase [Staphylococcus aureus]